MTLHSLWNNLWKQNLQSCLQKTKCPDCVRVHFNEGAKETRKNCIYRGIIGAFDESETRICGGKSWKLLLCDMVKEMISLVMIEDLLVKD